MAKLIQLAMEISSASSNRHEPHQPHCRRARQDKEETNKIWRIALAGASAELVRSADRGARRRAFGYPVVTKPYDGNHGRGISIAGELGRSACRFIAARSIPIRIIVGPIEERTMPAGRAGALARPPHAGRVSATERTRFASSSTSSIKIRGAHRHEKVMTGWTRAQAEMMLARKGDRGFQGGPGSSVLLRTPPICRRGTPPDVTDIILRQSRHGGPRGHRHRLDVARGFLCPTSGSYKTVAGVLRSQRRRLSHARGPAGHAARSAGP